MSEFKFISANETYKALFYQLPKVLFESNKYIDLSNDSKIAYAMLKDRCEYSLQNNWIDEDGNIYFIFTTEELMELLHCKNGKVAKIKRELQDFGLLLSKRIPPKRLQDGSFESVPSRLYLGQLDLTATDVYMEKEPLTAEDSKNAKIALLNKPQEIRDFPKNAKIALLEETPTNQPFPENAKIARNLYKTNNLDTKRHLLDTETDQLQDQLLLDNFTTLMQDPSIGTFIPEKVLNIIKVFSANYTEAQQTVKTIHNAKHKAETESGVAIIFEELDLLYGLNADHALYTTVLKAYQKQKTEKVENMQNLIFVYAKNWFVEHAVAAITQAEETDSLPKVTMHNWLE